MPDINQKDAETSTPRPDPTDKTEQAVNQSAEQLRREMQFAQNIIAARMDGMDQRANHQQQAMDLLLKAIRTEVEHLQMLHAERFKRLETQISERDTQTEKAARDVKAAVDAAFAAQKEAVGEQNRSNALAIAKSEAGFTKQLDQIGLLVSTMGKALEDKIATVTDGLRGRIDDMKALAALNQQASAANSAALVGQSKGGDTVWGYAFGIAGILIGIGGLLLAFRH